MVPVPSTWGVGSTLHSQKGIYEKMYLGKQYSRVVRFKLSSQPSDLTALLLWSKRRNGSIAVNSKKFLGDKVAISVWDFVAIVEFDCTALRCRSSAARTEGRIFEHPTQLQLQPKHCIVASQTNNKS